MLLSNWLGTLTSRIKKRPVYRSRDRRAIRRRWQAAVHNQVATTEVLEDRTLLTTFGLQSELLPELATNPDNGDFFGLSVAVDGDWMVVGAREDDNGNGANAGAVTLYSRNDTGTPADQSDDTWDFHSTILSPSVVAPNGDRFGRAVDIDGNSLIVSAPLASDGETRGSAYIFTRTDPGMSPTDLTDDVWEYTKTLSRPSGLTSGANFEEDGFGVSVSISGSTAVVGAEFGDLNTTDSGAVYVFDTADNWGSVSVSAITAGDPANDSRFGYSVSISGDTILAGAWLDDTVNLYSGAVYVFERNDQTLIGDITDDTWDQSVKLKSPDVQQSGGYGISVDLDGDIAVVGARSESFDTSNNAGAAYVYDGSTGWSSPIQLARLAASDAHSNHYFGSSVSIDGDLVVVGTLDAEAIYVYDGSTGWGSAVEQIIPKPGVPTSDEFGYSVSISGETIAVGAYDAFHDYGAPTGTVRSGTAYAFGVTSPPAVVYVDDNFSNPVAGQDPDDAGLATNFGYDAFATIQEAIDAVADGGTIHIAAGTYSGNVSVNKSVTLAGANAGIAAGVDSGARGLESELTGGFRLFANDVVIDGLKIVGGTGPLGIGSISAVFMTAGTTGHTIENSILAGPGTGVESRGVLSTDNGNNDNITIQNNEIYDWVAGIHNQGNTNVDIFGNNIHHVFVGVANDDVAEVSIEGNAFSNSVEGIGVNNNISNGIPDVAAHNNFFDSLTLTNPIAHYGGDTVDASGNWWGGMDETAIANSMMSDGDDGNASKVDFTSFLNVETDTSGAAGFQGDFSTLNVTALGAQTGPNGRIQEAIANVIAGGTVNILSGTYTGNVDATGIDITLAPGNSPGQVVINGDLILDGGDTLEIEIDSAVAGTGFDQFVVNGAVTLGGAALNLVDGYNPAEGDRFMLIDNNLGDTVTGLFAGLPEGYEFENFLGVADQSAYLTYAGGDGNDVVIVVEDSTPEIPLPTNGTPDEYSIAIVDGNVVTTDMGGNVIDSTPLASLEGTLVINGAANENDTLIVDLTGIDQNTPLQIEFNGGAGGHDTLELVGGGLASIEYLLTDASSGSVRLNGSMTDFIIYTGLEPVVAMAPVGDVTLTFGAFAETINVNDAGGGQIEVTSTAGETHTFNNPTGTLTLNTVGGMGVDTININGVDAAFMANLTVQAGSEDVINIGTVDIDTGLLTLSAGAVNVNGAVIANGGVDIDSTLGNITFIGSGVINAGNTEIDLNSASNVNMGQVITSSEVRITASNGGINAIALPMGVNHVTADRVALTATVMGGITGLKTDVNTLAASATGGGFSIDNTGDLEIGSVGGETGITANASTVFLTTTGQLTVSEAVSAGTVGYLRTVDAAGAGQDIIVNAGVTSMSGDLHLQAGDNIIVDTGVTLNAMSGELLINIDTLSADAAGGIANLNGMLTASSGITVTGGSDDDQVIIDGNGGGTNDGGTVDGILSSFLFAGGGGTDELIVDDSGDGTGDAILIGSTIPGSGAVAGAGGVSLGFEGLENLTLFAGSDADTITVAPNVTTAIDIRGGNPMMAPGDTLIYQAATSTYTPTGPGAGTIGAVGVEDVEFDGIEALTFSGSIEVEGTTGDDVLTITATGTNSGTFQLGAGPVATFSGMTDFTFNGGDGDDRLVIDNTGAGGVFNPSGGITFHGEGEAVNGDRLDILGGTATTVSHSFTTDNNGSISFNGGAGITYTGLEPILDTIAADERTFNYLGADETITLSDSGTAGQSFIDSDFLGESVTFANPGDLLTISSLNGTDAININGVGSGFGANLTVNASTNDTITTTAVNIGTGLADLNADQVNVNGTLTATGGVDIDANTGLTFAAAGIISAGGSNIDLTAVAGNIALGQATTGGDVTVTATAGAITDVNAGNNITAVNATLESGLGTGVGNALETAITSLQANTGGGLQLDNAGTLNLGITGPVTVGGASIITSTGTMTVTEDVTATGGNLQLRNTGGNFVLNTSTTIENDGAFGIQINSVAGAVTLAEGSEVTSSGTGLIDIDALNNIALANVNTGGEVQVTAGGSITDNTTMSEAALIDANTVALRAGTDVGDTGGADIDLDVNVMVANATSGNIFLHDLSLTTVSSVNSLDGITAGGNINLNAGFLNLNEKIEATGMGSTIVVNSSATIFVNDIVRTDGGTIDLLANTGLSLFSPSSIDTTNMANVTLAGGGGAFTQSNGSMVNAHGGDLDVSAAGDVSLVNLQSDAGLITIESTTGEILDVSGMETPLIIGGSVAMDAATGIGGDGDDIDTQVSTLAATTTTGNIDISNTGALTIDTIGPVAGVVTGVGSVNVSAASPITVNSNVSGSGTVTLTAGDSAAAGDNLTIDANVTVQSTGADVILTAGDNFTMDSTSSILASSTIDITIDPTAGDPDAAVGGILNLVGIINAAGGTTLRGGNDNDIFNVLPSGNSAINVIGGSPALPTFPGDQLNIDLTGLTTPVLTLGAAAGSGTFSFLGDPEQDVTYSSIENVNTLAAAYHLVLDMENSGYENGVADTIDAALDAGGTNLVLDVNSTNIFTGADADILSFSVLGSTDADTLNINESAGGVLRFTAAAPSIPSSSMGSHLNNAADSFLETEFNPNTYDATDITLHYDGGQDPGMGGPTIDTINVNFTTDHHVGYFSDLLDAQGSGNIVAAETGLVSDIDFGLSFGNVELVGINGTAAGSLLVDASSTSGTTLIELEDFGTNADGISELRSNGGLSNTLFSGFDELRVISGLGSETIDLISLDPTSTLANIELDAGSSLVADSSNDIIRVRSTSAGVTNINILAGLGNDSIQIYDGTNTVDNINGAIFIFGEDGTDTLTVIDSGDSTAPGDIITVTSTTISGLYPATITFTDIDTLNVTGTGGADTINVDLVDNLDLDFVNINGSDGDDVFNLNTITPDMVDTRLNGNDGADDFIFMAGSVLRGFINGGADLDTIDYSNYTTAVYIALATLGTTDGFRGRETTVSFDHVVAGADFDNIDDLIGTGNNDTLQGANYDNYWGITSQNGGLVIADRANLMIGRPTTTDATLMNMSERLINFASFENLVGGTQDDRFDLTDTFGLTGSLNGGAGNDSLDYRDYSTGIVVDLNTGTATNIGGNLLAGTGGGNDDNSIENVFGGDGVDFITGDNDNNILGDGLGSDTLDGGDGNDVFLMEPGGANSEDIITDIHGNDTIDFRFASQGIVFDLDLLNEAQTVFGSSTVELRQIQSGDPEQQPDTNPSFMENIVGSEFNDTIFIDPLSQDGNFPIDGPPVLRSADGRGGVGDVLDFDAKGQEVIDTGFSLTSDGVGTVQYLNFETVRPFEDSPAFIVDNGDQGFTLTGDWSYSNFNGTGFEDDINSVPQTTPTGHGDAQAFWEFFGLTPGEYRISVTWPVSTNPSSVAAMASNAPFTVYDGARTDVGTSAIDLGTTLLDQQLEPDDFTADGTVWEDLGSFVVNSRTLTVMLTNTANGRIIADAIRIERVSDGPEVELRDVTDLVAPPTIIVDGQPGGINFGATELLTPAVRSFEITNHSTTDVLTISNIDIPAGFTTDLVAGPIGTGATVAFTITMDATTFGDRSGIFSFETDDEDEAVFNILLDGQVSNVVIIDDGDLGFSAPDFVNFPTSLNQGSSGYEGDVTAAIPNQPGNTDQPGAATATWTFTGLAAGNYQVSTTWSPFYNRVDDAPYSLDGGAGTFDLDVNQKVFPSSFTENGTAWFELIDSFEVSAAGVLTVTLTNDANSFPRDNFDGAYGVIADAIRIEYLPEPDIEVMVDGEVVDDDTGNVDFGSTLPGVPVIKTFTVTNLSSTLPVTVTGLLEFPPGFSISPASEFGTDEMPVSIAAGDSVTFIVQFDGGTTGSTTGFISFTTGDEDENPYNFTVSGTAGPATVELTDAIIGGAGWQELVYDPNFLYAGGYGTGGTGTNTATWNFDVEPGRYQVVAHWFNHPGVTTSGRGTATNAPYTIYNNGAFVTTTRVDQSSSSNDFLDDGIYWEYIGDPVEITGSTPRTLSVQLSDDANGIVYADEIRIYRVVDPVIKVEVDGETVEDGGTVDFGDTIIDSTLSKTFTVTNYGERNMALGTITVPTGFTLLTDFGNTNLPPGASTTFTLQMDTTMGSVSGMVMFGADTQDANPFNFTVTGIAQDSMIVDNGDAAYSTSGAAWETRTEDSLWHYFDGDRDLLTDLTGVNTATWSFADLPEGTYQISSTWTKHSSLASNAEYTISGIAGGSVTVNLNQRSDPNDFNADGADWEDLGYFQVGPGGGTVTVTLSDNLANGLLNADAIRLELIPSGSPEIDVQVGGVDLTDGVSSVDFGTAFFDESLFQTVTVTNNGTDTLDLSAGITALPAGFTVSSPLGVTSLAVGHSTTFVLEFNSTGVAGVFGGVVEITSNDSDEAVFTFNVSATMTDVAIIDDGDAGFSTTGAYFNFGSLYSYGKDAQRLNAGTNGTATWDFTNLPAGSYTVWTTWYKHGSRASNAEYTVSVSGVPDPVDVVSQRVAPDDLTVDGRSWEALAMVTVLPGGSITVELSDNAADGTILADAVRIQRTGALMAAGGESGSSAPSITQADLNSVRDAALNYWESTGLSEAQLSLLESVSFVLADLPDAMLGGASSTTILIDINAAGYGWFVDDTPFDSSEFTLDADGNLVANEMGPASGRMDLLTVMMHELGHTLGHDHLDADEAGHDLMSESLGESSRRLPTINDAESSDIDDFFSSMVDGENPLLN